MLHICASRRGTLWLVSEGVLLLTGAPLDDFTPNALSYVLAQLQTSLPIGAYSTSTGR
ncbi:MAG: hypothetical protein ABIN97_10780 [Ginsengibacter sp.]